MFVGIVSNLSDDPSVLVKNQLLEFVNSLLMRFPKETCLAEMWLEIITNLIRDNDAKISTIAIQSMSEVFQKIESFENTVSDLHLLPWSIMRLVIKKNKRKILQNAIGSTKKDFLTQDKIKNIETHLFTTHKSEAWCLLSIVAQRMKSNNPDIIVKTFLDHIDHLNDSTYDSSDLNLILEVLMCSVLNLNKNSKTQIALKIR